MALGPSDVSRRQVGGATLMTVTDSTYPIVRFTLALRVGAMADPPGRRGALAMLLPLMLRGTRTKSREAYNAQLETLGSSIDAVVGHDLAYFSGTTLKQHLAPTLALLAEALTEPALDPQQLQALCEEAIGALISERDDDDSVADHFLRQALYPGHPLYHPATGTIEGLRKLDVAALERARKQFAPERIIIAMVGDITADEAEALAKPLLQPLPRAFEAPPVLPAVPRPKAPQIVLVDKPDRTQVQLRVARPGLSSRHPDIDAFWLGVNAFGGTFTSPLTREVRDVRGWSYFAQADFRRRSLVPSPVVLRTAPALEDALDCLALKLTMFEELAQGKLEMDSIVMARDYLLGRVPFMQATAFDVMGPAVMLDILGLPQENLWDLPERLAAVDLNQVPAVMKRTLAGSHPLCVMVAPASEVEAEVRRRFGHAEITVVPFDAGLEG